MNAGNGGPSNYSRTATIPDYFNKEGDVAFAPNDDTKSTLVQMFPNVSKEKIDDVLSSATNWEEAVDALSTKDPINGAEMIEVYIRNNLNVSTQKVIEIDREDIWREALAMYKIANVDKMVLF